MSTLLSLSYISLSPSRLGRVDKVVSFLFSPIVYVCLNLFLWFYRVYYRDNIRLWYTRKLFSYTFFFFFAFFVCLCFFLSLDFFDENEQKKIETKTKAGPLVCLHASKYDCVHSIWSALFFISLFFECMRLFICYFSAFVLSVYPC